MWLDLQKTILICRFCISINIILKYWLNCGSPVLHCSHTRFAISTEQFYSYSTAQMWSRTRSPVFSSSLDTQCSSLDKYLHKFYESQGWCRGLDWLSSITRGNFHFVTQTINSSNLLQLDHSLAGLVTSSLYYEYFWS